MVEILNEELSISNLEPGKTITVSFDAIARSDQFPNIKFPLSVEGLLKSRRIGLLETVPMVPVMNDYLIRKMDGATTLKQGYNRLEYFIINNHFIF